LPLFPFCVKRPDLNRYSIKPYWSRMGSQYPADADIPRMETTRFVDFVKPCRCQFQDSHLLQYFNINVCFFILISSPSSTIIFIDIFVFTKLFKPTLYYLCQTSQIFLCQSNMILLINIHTATLQLMSFFFLNHCVILRIMT
jgi:hypothetical protein